ncbi:hypothetical protein ACFFP0_06705 [Rhizobium puerariae]|uniref:DMSO/TMAO reductase YedYZ heme-binding membrane subunit n=1 Tax=Rhizobium puerariae TaxID=1585791 RepID=A0ABV6AF81_9HYPH
MMPNRWRLTGSAALLLLAMVLAMYGLASDTAEASRLVIRWTARLSLVLFLMAFTASAWARLVPNGFTLWQVRNRRYLGLSFALSHIVHLAAIGTLLAVNEALFWQLTNMATIFAGGLAYVFILLMAVTSFDPVASAIGRRAWRWLHGFGAWYIWMSFVFTFGKRAVMDGSYLPAMALIFAALGIRLLACFRPGDRAPSQYGNPT